MAENKKKKVVRMKLADLKPSPLQGENFGACSPAEDAALAADLTANGQRDPIHVMPAGNKAGWPALSILDGHRRAERLGALGLVEADVWVRWDLVDADAGAVEQIFLQFNSNRRQLHPLDRAAIVLRHFEIEKGKARGGLSLSCHENEARDRVGKLVGWSGRHLQRMFRILLTPRPIQNAVRDGYLPVVMAEKVEALGREAQQEIATRVLENPKIAKAIVAEYVGTRDGRHHKTVDALASFARGLEIGLKDLHDRVESVRPVAADRVRATLEVAAVMIARLLEIAGQADASKQKPSVTKRALRSKIDNAA